MGFLDNSGDIILDAVLTDTGRKRMAQGTFSITKFAIGDDEIDYGLYNKSHPSGTAYYDLEILQTPIFEAFTQTNAGINYGLMSHTNLDLLYLPTANINKKLNISNTIAPQSAFPNIYFLADTSTDTTTKLLASTALGSTDYFMVSNQKSGPAILLESGLDTIDIRGSSANRSTYLTSKNLIDNYFYVYYDTRFINGVLGPAIGTVLNNTDSGDGTVTFNYSLTRAAAISTDLQLENYGAARVAAPSNGIEYDSSYAPADTTVSIVSGPRANFTVLNFEVIPTISDVQFSRYGTTSNDLFGDGSLFSFIDTVVYVQGARTGMQAQIPLRIIKYVSS